MKRKFDPQKVLDEINEKLQRLAEETGGGAGKGAVREMPDGSLQGRSEFESGESPLHPVLQNVLSEITDLYANSFQSMVSEAIDVLVPLGYGTEEHVQVEASVALTVTRLEEEEAEDEVEKELRRLFRKFDGGLPA